jgi:uncharacterized protein (DUF58 family)
MPFQTQITVYPQPLPFFSEETGLPSESGERERQLRGEGEDLHALRAYQVSDDARRIHWKISAKAGEPIVKETAAAGRERLTIVFDTRGADGGAFERAVSAVTYLLCEANQQGIESAMITPDRDFPAASGDDHLHLMLAYLAVVSPSVASVKAPDASRAQGALYHVHAGMFYEERAA